MKTGMFVSIILVTIFLAACGPAYVPEPTQTPQSIQPTTTPDLTVDIKTLNEKTEKELVSFMLNYILQTREYDGTSYVQTRGEPWLNPPESVTIINYWNASKKEEFIKVWWYFDNQLVEATDNQIARRKWDEYYGYGSSSHDWAEIGFGILSLSDHNTKATIYYSLTTCTDCGAAWLMTLEKNASGKWLIIKDELLWMG